MSKTELMAVGALPGTLPTAAEGPVEQRVQEVYAAAPPAVQANLLSQLVGRLYEVAPVTDRGSLVAHLMRPLGILSLVAIAGGIFARIRFRYGLSQAQISVEDLQNIDTDDVVALANYAQQVSAQVIDGMTQILSTSPALASTASAALLISIVMQRQKNRRSDDI